MLVCERERDDRGGGGLELLISREAGGRTPDTHTHTVTSILKPPPLSKLFVCSVHFTSFQNFTSHQLTKHQVLLAGTDVLTLRSDTWITLVMTTDL